MSKFIDTHLHLLDQRFSGRVPEIIKEAETAGVGLLICNTTVEQEWRQALDLSQRYQTVKTCLGIHPWFSDQVTPGWQNRLAESLDLAGGIGETGLDRLAKPAIKQQERVFIEQLELASHFDKPITIHCVKAWGRLLEILRAHQSLGLKLLLHSFGGSSEIMHQLLDMGAFFSFSAALAAPNRKKLRQVFKTIPLNHLLLETDSPDQYVPELFDNCPVNRKNMPCWMPEIYNFAASLRELTPQQLTDKIWENGQIFTN